MAGFVRTHTAPPALQLRELINEKYLAVKDQRLKTRTLYSIVDLVEGQGEARHTA